MLLFAGIVISLVQEIVINGLPLKVTGDIWGEILYATIYISFLLWIQGKVTRRILWKKSHKGLTAENVAKAFILTQTIGFMFFFFLGFLLEFIIKGSVEFKLKPFVQLRFLLIYYFLLNTITYGSAIVYYLYVLYSREKEAKYQAEKSFLSAQLQMLRQQLNPHFLFNNLNIIASTIYNEPKLAYEFTRSMASFYRKVLESDNEGWVTLRQELSTIQSYLYMLGVRFEDKLTYTIDIPEDLLDEATIPDFILQPIIENAIKHNHCSKKQPLDIKISATNGRTLFIKNTYQPKESKQDSLGVGWFNIENRYRYLGGKVPEKYVEDGWYVVEIELAKK